MGIPGEKTMPESGASTDRDRLSPAKRALLERRVRAGSDGRSPSQLIARRPNPRLAPLSFVQLWSWRLYQETQESSFYSRLLHFKGSLNTGVVERSLNEMFRRHEALRTTFDLVDGEPCQIVWPPQHVSIPLVDLTELPEQQQQKRVRSLVEQNKDRRINLAEGPLLKVTLFKLSEDEHIALVIIYHIICDRWALGLIVKEFATLYNSFINDLPTPLSELPIQYGDFACWQRESLTGQTYESLRCYWEQQLSGSPLATPLLPDHKRPALQSFRAAAKTILFTKNLTDRIKAVSQSEGVTIFIVLLSLFKCLIYRLTWHSDIVIQTPIANRTRSEFEQLIGSFVNTLLLRTSLAGNPPFREVIKRVRESAYGGYANQDMPYTRLREELRSDLSGTYLPVHTVVFSLHSAPLESLSISGLLLNSLSLAKDRANYDLLLEVTDDRQGLIGSIKYNIDLFDEGTIILMLKNLHAFTEAVINDPDRPILSLPLLSSPNMDDVPLD
jgi:condensation domain-containing protein